MYACHKPHKFPHPAEEGTHPPAPQQCNETSARIGRKGRGIGHKLVLVVDRYRGYPLPSPQPPNKRCLFWRVRLLERGGGACSP